MWYYCSILLLSILSPASAQQTYLPSNQGKYFFVDIENTGNSQDDFADFMSYNSIPALISTDEIEQRYGVSMNSHAIAVYDKSCGICRIRNESRAYNQTKSKSADDQYNQYFNISTQVFGYYKIWDFNSRCKLTSDDFKFQVKKYDRETKVYNLKFGDVIDQDQVNQDNNGFDGYIGLAPYKST